MKNQKEIVALANRFLELDIQRLELERQVRPLKKELEALKKQLQEHIGKPEAREVPLIVKFGKLVITQVLKFRGGYVVNDGETLSFDVGKE